MASQRCPGCGAPYNGKKCRACLYEPMETDLSRRTEKTAPLPAGKPAPAKPKKRRSAGSSLGGFFVILALIAMTMPTIQNWGVKLEAIEAANMIPEPIPGNPAVLHQQESITVLVPEQEVQGDGGISLWFYNHDGRDYLAVCKDITVNGSRIDEARLVLDLAARSAIKGTLLSRETLAGFQQIEEISFVLEVSSFSGALLFETAPLCLKIG